jgi:monovalent cation:H+ antiporter-2, CPA2 family
MRGGIVNRLVLVGLRRLWTGAWRRRPCGHVRGMAPAAPLGDRCEACVALGDGWPDLRVCLTCGFVGCCDRSKNRHALRHYEETGHPLVRPLGPKGARWIWCRVDGALIEPEALAPPAE